MTTLLAVLAFAVLFVIWGLMHPMDHGAAGCHACPHGDDRTACGSSCALFADLESKPKVGVER